MGTGFSCNYNKCDSKLEIQGEIILWDQRSTMS